MESSTTTSEEQGSLLQTFWGLSSLDENEQLTSAAQLINQLKKSQDEASESEPCSELEYSLKRLVRGLASNRKGARQGYFIALTEMLCLFPMVPVRSVLKLVQSHLEPTASDKAAEERGAYFGKIFALLSLVKSGRLSDEDDLVTVFGQLHVCAQKKSYLKEFCFVGLANIIDICNTRGNVSFIREHVVPVVSCTGWDDLTAEQLFLYLTLSSHFEKEKWFKKLLNEQLGSKYLVSAATMESLASVLRESTGAHPRLHSVWALVLPSVRAKGLFNQFWSSVVDDSLFSSSHERRYLGFLLLETLLPSLTAAEVPAALSPNLLSCLLNNCTSKDNYLYSAAMHLLSELSSFVSSCSDKDCLLTLYIHFQRVSNNRFDHLYCCKLLDGLLCRLSAEDVELLLDKLLAIVCEPESTLRDSDVADGVDASGVQLWALDHLLLLLRQRKLPQMSSWMLKAVKALLVLSVFTDTTLPSDVSSCVLNAPLPASSQLALCHKLASALTDLSAVIIATPREDGTKRSVPGVMEDGGFFLTELVRFAARLLKNGSQLAVDFTDKVSASFETVMESVSTLLEKEAVGREERSFLLLFSALGLQLLTSPDERASTAKTAQEAEVCFNEMQLVLSKRRTPKKSKAGPDWMAVLTDLLLGLLSNPSQLWRNIVDQVFKQLTHCVNSESLKLILAVLEPKQSKDELMEDSDSEGSEAVDSGSEAGESGSEAGVSEGSDSEECGAVDPMFRAEVQKALGAAAIDSDAQSEGSVDDEFMMAVDGALAEVFRTRFSVKHQNKVKQGEEKSVVNFKLRVLGMVEAFIRKESSNPLVLDTVFPLYELVQCSQNKRDHSQLVERAKGVFINRLCHMKDYPKTSIDVSAAHDCLHKFVQQLSKANSTTAPLCTQGFLLLVRVLRANQSRLPVISPLTTRSGRKRKRETKPEPTEHGQLDVSMVTDWVTQALQEYITKKNTNINPVFFTTFIERYPSLGVGLLPTLVKCMPSSANHFRKTKVYEMLSMLRSHANGEDRKCPFNQLSNEDLIAVDALISSSKKRKRN